jgi:hypothetical protein
VAKPKTKPQIYVSSTGAEYELLPWDGLQRFRRCGGYCSLCGTSNASHPAIGCDIGELI